MSICPTQTLEGSLTISNPSDGMVRIEIRDEVSRRRFVECRITHHELMQALMGLAERPVTFNVKDLEKIGKVMHSQPLRVALPPVIGYGGDRKAVALKHIFAEIGKLIESTGKPWVCTDQNLSSQGSFGKEDGVEHVNTTISYWE